jgi:hypothetical protein
MASKSVPGKDVGAGIELFWRREMYSNINPSTLNSYRTSIPYNTTRNLVNTYFSHQFNNDSFNEFQYYQSAQGRRVRYTDDQASISIGIAPISELPPKTGSKAKLKSQLNWDPPNAGSPVNDPSIFIADKSL